ncbi:MAG: CBS domain-containing protein [Gammaproteobacteria bacterium]|nr:CBS domain-containing protein [Gammaproteobacteria bacterium]
MNENNSTHKSWLDRLSSLIHKEPQDRQEIMELLRLAASKDVLDNDALMMIEGVLQVSEIQVRDIMVPRSQMVVVDQDAHPRQFLPIIIESQHSRFPVIGENRDEITGVLLAKELLKFAFTGEENFNIRTILRPAIFIPESKRLNVLLKEFRLNRNHMAIVVDEYGGISGLVTIEDVLEQIVGEIEDEYDIEDISTYIRKLNENLYTVKALTPIEKFNEYFDTNFSADNFDTIGGVVMQKFGKLPKKGDSIQIDNCQFKVLHADNRRIRLLRVSLLKK